jgi:hypothetical protein
MARFYKTQSANPLDYMYRMNTPLMERVISANDQYISENLNQLGQLSTVATSFPYLQADEARAREVANQYSGKIDEVTKAITEDPANWKKQLNPMRSLSKELQNDYRTGEISKIMSNSNKVKSTFDYIDKQVEQYNKDGKGISADRARAYKQYFLSNFKGTSYNPKSGEYNQVSTFDPMGNIDIRKSLSEELDKMKADGTIRVTDKVSGNGEYFNKETNKWEGITPEKILRIATDRLNNPQLMDYLRQDSQVGLIRGVFDMTESSPSYGKFISPYNYEKVGLNSSEQAIIDSMKKQIQVTKDKNLRDQLQGQLNAYANKLNSRQQVAWNKDSYLAPIMRGIVDQYSYQQTESQNDISANPIWEARFNQAQANSRNNADIAASKENQERALASQKQLQDERLAAEKELKLLEWANKPKPGTSKTKAGEKDTKQNTDNFVAGNTYSTPFYWTTENKEKMTTGLNDEILTNQNGVTQLEKSLGDIVKEHPNDKILIANAENQLSAAKVKLNTLQAQRDNAVNYGVNEWKAKGSRDVSTSYSDFNERLVREYLSGSARQKVADANNSLKAVEAQRQQMIQTGVQPTPDWMRQTYLPAKQRVATAEGAFTTGLNIFNNEVKSYSDNKLEKAAKETTNKNVVVATTQGQDERILDLINLSPSNYKIRNSEGREINLSFEHGTSIADKANIKVKGVSTSTGLGNKQIEVIASVKGSDGKFQDVIITPTDDDGRLNNYFGEQFKQSKDKDVHSIGNILTSPTASVISDMMTEMRMNTSTNYGTLGNWVYKLIPNPANPRETIKIRARPISTGVNGSPKWEFQYETGDVNQISKHAGKGGSYVADSSGVKGFVPLISTRSATGEYHNLDDILSIFPSN